MEQVVNMLVVISVSYAMIYMNIRLKRMCKDYLGWSRQKEVNMNKVAIVFYSGTGNTELMASSIAEGVKNKSGIAELFSSKSFDPSLLEEYQAFAFGCPASGAENLEEFEFQPMFDAILPKLKGKNISLFGSYGWGDGEWMRVWEERMKNAGATLVGGAGVICNEAPDAEAVAACKALGVQMAQQRNFQNLAKYLDKNTRIAQNIVSEKGIERKEQQ